MSAKKKIQILSVISLLGALPLALLLFVSLDPELLSAASGWYGYNGSPVVPEASSAADLVKSVAQRNNSISNISCDKPIQYLDGVLDYQADGISVPSPAFSFSFRPTYNNNHEGGTATGGDGDIKLSLGYNWHSGIPQLVDMGSGEIRLVGRGNSSTAYKDPGSYGTYVGQMGADSKIVHFTTPKEMVLYGTNGSSAVFHDFDSSHGDLFGALKKIVDPSGKQLTVDYYTSGESSNLQGLVQTITDPGEHSWVFTYIDNTGSVNNRLLQKVEVKDGSTVLAKAEYLYYDSTSGAFASGSGTNQDLMRITVTEGDSDGLNLVRVTLFRYWTGIWSGSNHGATHKLKYIVNPESYSELAAAVADPLKATNTEIADHADFAIEYDSLSRVTQATISGAGCGCGSGHGVYVFSYATNGSWTPSSAFSVWKVSVTQTNPDSRVRIVDVNGGGSILNDVFQTDATYGGTDQRWIEHYEFDSYGRITERYHPSACSAYSTSTHTATIEESVGLVEVFVYDGNGNLSARRVKKGSSGTEYWLEASTFTSNLLGYQTIYLPSSRTVFRTEIALGEEEDGDGDTTTFTYDLYPDSLDLDGDLVVEEPSLLVEKLTVEHPEVIADENGSGTADTHGYYYNLLGQLEWERDERGSITYRAYHTDGSNADLGLLVTTVVDMDTDGFSPPTGFSSSTGLSLETSFDYLADGKLVEMIDPEGRSAMTYYSHLSGQPAILRYPYVDGSISVGPARIEILDYDRRVIARALGDPSDHDNVLSDDWNSAASTLHGAFAGTLYQRKETVYSNGQSVETNEWNDPYDDDDATWNRTFYGYDNAGRLARTKDAEGTITRSYYTVQGRLRRREVGTNDYGATDPPGESSGTNNMTKTEEYFYDGEESSASAVGDGNLTLEKSFVSASSSRDVAYGYDWRNRRSSADGGLNFFEKLDYDNLDRVTVGYRYEGSESATNLRSKSESKYDARGRVYQSIVYEVDPSNGTIDDSLTEKRWYDARGDLIKSASPSGLFQKTQHDGARRWAMSFVSYDPDETAYADADDVAGDTVLSQTKRDFDAVGNVLLTTRWERQSTGTDLGALTTSSAVRYYVATWYDELDRAEAVADYGTNGDADLTDYDPNTEGNQSYADLANEPPSSSSLVLVSEMSYNAQGLLETTTSPGGQLTLQDYDDLGRVIRVISNYDADADGTPGPGDEDRTMEIEYNAVSKVTHRKTWMSGSSDVEDTEYVWGVAQGSIPDSEIATGNLLAMIKYPDPSTGNPSSSSDDQESFAYNAQGELVYRKDQNGTVHEYDFDELGRRTADKVTTVGTGIDGSSVRMIMAAYDALDRHTAITSWDAVEEGNVVNQVAFVYNGFGQLTESAQEHAGSVDEDTLEVVYNFSEAAGGDPLSRLTSIEYPATSRTVYFHYDASSGSDHEKMDWISGRVSAVSNESSPSGERLANYAFEGLGRVISRNNQEPSADLGVDSAYDRFGRLEYLTATGSSTLNNFRYGFDLDSNVIWREENAETGKDEFYAYDDLDRLDIFKRGDLNGGRTDIDSPVRDQDWGLDLVGNWQTIATNGTTITRSHNPSNEITDVDTGYSGEDPTYDKNGNTTFIQRPTPAARTFVYDPWNRLVEVKFGGVSLLYYSYDGMGRRIGEVYSGEEYYYSAGWRILSERDGTTTSDKTLREYVWGTQYIDEILERSEDKNSDGDTRDAADESLFYVQDGNWNVHTLVDEAGDAAERVLYDPYGTPSFFDESWDSLGGASAKSNRVLFTGRLWTTGSYSYEYRNREYSPYLGRFLQRDPIGTWGDRGSAGNGYVYTSSSPVARADALGLESCITVTHNVTERNVKKSIHVAYTTIGRIADIQVAVEAQCDEADGSCLCKPKSISVAIPFIITWNKEKLEKGVWWNPQNPMSGPNVGNPADGDRLIDKENIRVHEMEHVKHGVEIIQKYLDEATKPGPCESQVPCACKCVRNGSGDPKYIFLDVKKCEERLEQMVTQRIQAIAKKAWVDLAKIGDHTHPRNPVEERAREAQADDFKANND